jgi:uncharacterized RDD family membrane protein YckC
MSATEFDFMHWLYRLIAYIIDGIIIAIPTAIIWVILTFAAVMSGGFLLAYGTLIIFPLIWGILEFLYFMVLDVMWGGTIGKRAMGFNVQTVNGGRITYSKSFIRNISKIYWPLTVLDWLIGVITTGDKRQKFTDRIANTVVAKQALQSVPPPPPPPP